jgi:hypothetical protein
MIEGSHESLGFDQIRRWDRSGSQVNTMEREHDTMNKSSYSPDGEIGRHSGLKIV